MPVSVQTPFNEHTGNGVTTVFTYEFAILQASDLKVQVGDDLVVSGFTVSGVGNRGGGAVTFSAAPAAGVAVKLYREIELSRATDYQENGDLKAVVLDDDLDRVYMILQNLGVDISRFLRAPFGESVLEMPDAAARASRVLTFDADGQLKLLLPDDVPGVALPAALASPDGAELVGYGAATLAQALDLLYSILTSVGGQTQLKGSGSTPVAIKNAAGTNVAVFNSTGTLSLLAAATNANHAVRLGELEDLLLRAMPIGAWLHFGGTTPPDGWLERDGSVVSLTTYPGLIAIYCGDGNNNGSDWGFRCTNPLDPFNSKSISGDYIVLPDARGRFDRGWSHNGATIDAGRHMYAYQADDNKAHSHTVPQGSNFGGGPQFQGNTSFNSNAFSTLSSGGSEARPHNGAGLAIIKAHN